MTTTNTTLTREEFKALAKEMLKNDKTLLPEIIKEMEEEESREQKVEKIKAVIQPIISLSLFYFFYPVHHSLSPSAARPTCSEPAQCRKRGWRRCQKGLAPRP